MAEDMTRMLDKIKKLVALSHSSNPNEAASAAAKVQALLEQYNLELSQVETSDQQEAYTRLDFRLGKARVWRRNLLTAIARAHFCEMVFFPGTDKVILIGQPHNSQVAHYLYGYLVQQLERMAEQAYRESDCWGSALSWKDAFFMGAVGSIRERLHTQHQTFQASSEASRALVVVSDAALKEAVQRFFPKVKTNRRSKQVASTDGYHEGQQAGRAIALNQALPSRRNT